MNCDLKPLALAFVRKHNCAATVPVELIVLAMEDGAKEMARLTTERLGGALEELREQRARNIGK